MCDVFLQLDGYCATFEAEIALQEQVSSLVSLLKNGQAFEISEEQSKQLSKEEKNALKNQSAQRKLDLVNQLTPLVDTYSDAVLKYMKVFQKVAISLEMVNFPTSRF